MTPGSLLLGNAGQPFECGHEHGVGDRCLSFSLTPAWIASHAEDAGAGEARFGVSRVPPLRQLTPVIARAAARAACYADTHADWDELVVEVGGLALELANGMEWPAGEHESLANEARVTRVVRAIDANPCLPHGLEALAHEARLTPYHFIRVFRRVTGVTPHQYVMRARLRRAATRLLLEPDRIVDIALDSGFDDLSNFNRVFRAEFGDSPRACRQRAGRFAHQPIS
jgi:AraC-like DNA-binding protein